MRVQQYGEYFIIQERISIFWMKFWRNVSLCQLWGLGAAYNTILFSTQESAIQTLKIIENNPSVVEYKGFYLHRCWCDHYSFQGAPVYYNKLHSSTTAGGFTRYYSKSVADWKIFIDEHLESKKKARIKKTVYKS